MRADNSVACSKWNDIIGHCIMQSSMPTSKVKTYVRYPPPFRPKLQLEQLCSANPPWCHAQVFNLYNPSVITDRSGTGNHLLHLLGVSVDPQPYGKAKGKGTSSASEAPYVQTSTVPRPSHSKAVSANRRVLI